MSFVFRPHAAIGKFKGLDLTLSSEENVCDSMTFDNKVAEFKTWISEGIGGVYADPENGSRKLDDA